ncbi:MAG TPA: amidohydrolase family protein [Mycobacteriales bacterium]|nr:amidohydrolase family protein [Mycobacteriales bacterium]
MSDASFQFRGLLLPEGVTATVGVTDGRVTLGKAADSTLVADNVWILPGFVDAHCHVGLEDDGAVDEARQRRQATQDRDGGTHTIRDCGVPADTRWIDGEDDLPQIVRAGRHIARPKRHTRDIGWEIEPDQLVATVEIEAARGDGWIKLVGDWIDREKGDLAPLWPRDALEAAIKRAHELGARVTAHTFSEEAPYDLVAAGIDCLEHGTGLTDEVIAMMAERQVALVPTLINIERFPDIADSAAKFPVYADHMRALHRGVNDRIRSAYEAGVPLFAGTDAGAVIAHGRVTDEIRALYRMGMSAKDALGAASWRAREWLGVGSGLAEGEIANFNVYLKDPYDMSSFAKPDFMVMKGCLYR